MTLTWMDSAACIEAYPEQAFPEDGSSPAPFIRSFCDRCPVRAECLTYGLGETEGVWGGLTRMQRRALRVGQRVTA